MCVWSSSTLNLSDTLVHDCNTSCRWSQKSFCSCINTSFNSSCIRSFLAVNFQPHIFLETEWFWNTFFLLDGANCCEGSAFLLGKSWLGCVRWIWLPNVRANLLLNNFWVFTIFVHNLNIPFFTLRNYRFTLGGLKASNQILTSNVILNTLGAWNTFFWETIH